MTDQDREDLLWEIECAISDSVDQGRWERTAAERVLEVFEKGKTERTRRLFEKVGLHVPR